MSMLRKFFVCLTLSLLTLTSLTTSAEAQRFKWWKDERFLKELALTPEQSARIEDMFQASQPALRAQKRALDKLEDELSKMIAEARVDEPELEQFAGRVEAARADLSKTRTLMLFRIRRVLTADQHQKLLHLFEKGEKEQHGKPHGPPRK